MERETAPELEPIFNIVDDEAGRELVGRAYRRAAEAHTGQKRLTGEAYISHPLAVAETLAGWGLDGATVAAGLLHDTVEDTDLKIEEIEEEFGPLVAQLVDGVTKIGEVDLSPGESRYVENLRKMLLAMAKDLRVLLIKLADRHHNMETLAPLKPGDRSRIARETLEIFAPLANRLGMGELKAELEDLSYRELEPERFAEVERELGGVLERRTETVEEMKRELGAWLKAAGVEDFQLESRIKHVYSIARKLEKEGSLEKIYDLSALRVIVPTVEDCYRCLGLVHEHWKPLIYRIKDYIAVPKPNGYQSLHTTVFGVGGLITEIQIRTPEMHELSVRGVAAHFYYDETKTEGAYREGGSVVVPTKLTWVNQLVDWQGEMLESPEALERLKIELFEDRIFLFSPRGDVYDLPEDSTPVDFAYRIHSGIGDRCMGAKVNGRIVTLDRKLENRDIVEILTSPSAHPSQDWLGFVRTSQARSRVKAYLRSLNRDRHVEFGTAELGRELERLGLLRLEKLAKARLAEGLDRLNLKSLEDLYALVGEGTVMAGTVLRAFFSPNELGQESLTEKRPAKRRARPGGEARVLVAGQAGLMVKFRACCHPAAGEPIVGVITKRDGITIHRTGCRTLRAVAPERRVEARWSGGGQETVLLLVTVSDRVGMVRDLTAVVSGSGFSIRSIRSLEGRNGTEVELVVEMGGLGALESLIRGLEQISGVRSVRRG